MRTGVGCVASSGQKSALDTTGAAPLWRRSQTRGDKVCSTSLCAVIPLYRFSTPWHTRVTQAAPLGRRVFCPAEIGETSIYGKVWHGEPRVEPIGVDTARIAQHSGGFGARDVWPGAGRPGRDP